jgi:hypothetical protein
MKNIRSSQLNNKYQIFIVNNLGILWLNLRRNLRTKPKGTRARASEKIKKKIRV